MTSGARLFRKQRLKLTPVPEPDGTMVGSVAALALRGAMKLEMVSYSTENDGNLFVNLMGMPGQGTLAKQSTKVMRRHGDGVSFPLNGDDDTHDERTAAFPDRVTLARLRN